MYVTANIGDISSVLVDIGTGYYVEKPPQKAQEYFKRKVEMLKANMERVEQGVSIKKQNLDVVSGFIQRRMAQQQQQQQQ